MNSQLLLFVADLAINSKRKLIATIIAVVLFLITAIGFIYTVIKNAAKNKAESIDIYLCDLVKYEILKDDKDVVKYVKKREKKNFYMRNFPVMLIFFIILIAFVILMAVCFNNDYVGAWNIVKDLSFKFSPLKFYNEDNRIGFEIPKLIKTSQVTLSFFGYSVYTMLVATLIMMIGVLRNSIILLAIGFRTKKIKYKLFSTISDK